MYELTYIVTPVIGELDLNTVAEKIRGFINDLGAEIKSEKIGEKRKIAYPIKKQNFGYYVTVDFKLDSDKIEQLQKELKTSNDILRHLLISKDEEIKQVRKLTHKISDKLVKSIEKIESSEITPAKKETSHKEEKVKIEELDKKLEEIIGE